MICDFDLQPAVEAMHLIDAQLRAMGVQSVSVFGSRGRGYVHPTSDWDLWVEFSRPISAREFFALKNWAETVLGRVSIVSPQYSGRSFCAEVKWQCVKVWPHV